MIDQVTLLVSDLSASRRFYALVLGALGREDRPGLAIAEAKEGDVTRGLHLGFAAHRREDVDAFWAAGTGAGHRDDGAPGPRPEYGHDYYGGFLLDPDGNSAEAVHHAATGGRTGALDHVWIRVASVARARGAFLALGDTGFRLRADLPERVQFTDGDGSFSFVAGEPTRGLHLRFRDGIVLRDGFDAG